MWCFWDQAEAIAVPSHDTRGGGWEVAAEEEGVRPSEFVQEGGPGVYGGVGVGVDATGEGGVGELYRVVEAVAGDDG